MKKLLLHLLLSVIIMSCIPEDLTIDNIPQAESKIVVSSVIRPETGLVVTLTKSVNALDGATQLEGEQLLNKLAVIGAEVSVGNINLQEVFPGVYSTQETGFANNTEYKLKVVDPSTNTTTEALSVYKSEVRMASAEAKAVKATSDTLAEISIEFIDNPNEKNWYMATAQPFSILDFEESFFSDENVFTHTFTDEEQTEFRITETFIALDFDGYTAGDSVLISFANISKEYFEFLEARENDITGVEFLYEPYNFPSNINSGFGLFSLHVLDQRIITVSP